MATGFPNNEAFLKTLNCYQDIKHALQIKHLASTILLGSMEKITKFGKFIQLFVLGFFLMTWEVIIREESVPPCSLEDPHRFSARIPPTSESTEIFFSTLNNAKLDNFLAPKEQALR